MDTTLTGIPETLLIPLWARAVEGKQADPIVEDQEAARMVAAIDYDFSKFEAAWLSQLGCSVRTMLLDKAASAFLARHPEAVVVNLGAGLDTRHARLNVRMADWYELDVPESIALRRRFFKESERYHFIAKSMFDESWMDDIADEGRPVLLLAEGVFMYFEEGELRELLRGLVARFPRAEMLLELLPPFVVGKSKHHDSLSKMDEAPEFKWGVKNSRDLEDWSPGIEFIEEWNYYDYYRSRWKWFGRVARLPFVKPRLSCRIARLRFAPDSLGEGHAKTPCATCCCGSCPKGGKA